MKRNRNFKQKVLKAKTSLFAFLVVAAFTVGCDRPSTISQQPDKTHDKSSEAAQPLKEKDYTYAQKAEFTETKQSQLDEINRDLDQLAAKIETSSDAARAEARPKLQALREKADKLGKQLDQARNATESTWDSVKAGSKTAFNELKDGFHQARQWVSEKIAP